MGTRLRLGALVVLVAVAWAGCTAPPAAPTAAPEPAPFVAEEALARLDLVRPEPVATESLDVSLALSERWLKPFRAFDATAATSAGARVAWFVELEGVEPRATVVDGGVFLLKSTTIDHHNTAGPRAPVAASDLAPDGRARAIKLVAAGRYVLEAGDARLTINVWPQAPASAEQAFLVESDGAPRFEPPELDVVPGTRVLLWNQASRSFDLRERSFAAHVPFDGHAGRATPIDEGLYRMLAVAIEGRARGVASLAFLVDFERPSDRIDVGPYAGEFLVAEAGVEEPRRVGFRAEHPLAELAVRYETGSLLPAPASIRVSLFRAGELVAQASSVSAEEMALADLPAGKYEIEVRGEHGAHVTYEIRAEGRYRLPMPERLLASTT